MSYDDDDDCIRLDVRSLTALLNGYCKKCGKNKTKVPKCGECGIVRIKTDLEDYQNAVKARRIRIIEQQMEGWEVPLSLSERKFMEACND